jgi:3-isopropylmalate dehydrogenase
MPGIGQYVLRDRVRIEQIAIGAHRRAIRHATHGSAPDIAGKGIANPYAMIESTRMMFEWLGHNRGIKPAVDAAASMKRGIENALADPATRTKDIRGTGGTNDMTRAVVAAIEAER